MSCFTQRLTLCLCLLTGSVAAPHPANALSLCGLLCSCTIAANNINFGGYDPTNNQAITATGTITVTCQLLSGLVSLLVPYTIGLSQGQAASYAPRKMAGPSPSMLNYNLYSDAMFSTVWEDIGTSQTVSSTLTVTLVGVNVSQMQTVYGQVPGSQNVKFGAYTDTITATLQF